MCEHPSLPGHLSVPGAASSAVRAPGSPHARGALALPVLVLGRPSQKESLPRSMSGGFFLFSFRSFMVSGLIFNPLIHLVFVSGVFVRSSVIFTGVLTQFPSSIY